MGDPQSFSQSEKIEELAAALSAAQAELSPVAKRGKNPHFKSTYAKLEDALEELHEVFPKHGLSISQLPFGWNDQIGVRTQLMHKSGQWIASCLMAKPGKPGPHEVGSLISYFRRYMALGIAGLGAEDDDGNAAQKKYEPPPPNKVVDLPVPTKDPEKEKALKMLGDRLRELKGIGFKDEEIMKQLNITNYNDILLKDAKTIYAALEVLADV